MSELATNTCRLCLKTVQNLDVINDCDLDTIEIVLPQIDLDNSDNPAICNECTELLQQSFAFKSKCLEIEDSIHDFKNDEKGQVNLEEILGIREDNSSECIKICRTCLGYLENGVFTELNKANDVKVIIRKCLPEMDIELTLNPVICEFCEELLKKIYDFITLCIQNDKKIKSYLKQSELIKDNCPSVEFSEIEIIDDSKTIKNNCEASEVRNTNSVTNTNGQDEIYVISDAEEDTIGTKTTKTSGKKSTGQRKSRKRRAPTEVIIDVDLDSSSGEEWFSRYKKKRSRKMKFNQNFNMMIYCKYCYYGTVSETSLKEHIASCPKNPCSTEKTLQINDISTNDKTKELENTKKDTTKNTVKAANITRDMKKTAIETNTLIEIVDESNEGNENSITTKNTVKAVNITKNKKKTAIETNTLIEIVNESNEKLVTTKNTVKTVNITRNMKKTAIETNTLIEILDESNEKSVTDNDLLFKEIEIVDDKFPSIEEVSPTVSKSTPILDLYPKVTKLNSSTIRNEVINDDKYQKNVELAIENNKKKAFMQLEVLMCNQCTFNSRSNLKMALHCSSHSSSSGNAVDYSNGYRTVFYCVNCTETFKTEPSLRSHVDSCSRILYDKVFLIRVGKVMHCTKCYFDSDDAKLVLQHLFRCGDINVER